MTTSVDLTRWNRASLTRFRYVEGNAATFLENLRLELLARFLEEDPPLTDTSGTQADWWRELYQTYPENASDPRGPLVTEYEAALRWTTLWEALGSSPETVAKRVARLEAQYTGPRRDWLWEIARTLARGCHVVAEYLDADANEGFLGTATQWDNVRRLVSMLDYHPAPPASAFTSLVVYAKGDGPGSVTAGLQVKHSPADGSPPVVFETLEDIDVSKDLNEVRLRDWDTSVFTFKAAGVVDPWVAPEGSDISAGQVALVVDETAGVPPLVVMVTGVNAESASLGLTHQAEWELWVRGRTLLLAEPAAIRVPRLNGTDVRAFDAPISLAAGDSLLWKSGGGAWRTADVLETDGRTVRLSGADLPAEGETIYRANPIERIPGGDLTLPSTSIVAGHVTTSGAVEVLSAGLVEVTESAAGFDGVTKIWTLSSSIDRVLFVPTAANPLGTVSSPAAGGSGGGSSGRLEFDGAPGELRSGQWVVVDGGSGLAAAKVDAVEEFEETYCVTLDPPPVSPVLRLYGPFTRTIRPVGHDRNETVLSGTTLDLATGALIPTALARGRKILLEQEAGTGFVGAVEATVLEVDSAAGVLEIEPAVDASLGFTVGNTVIRGNVVLAGHGETRPEKILGSGDAALTNQSFVLEVDEVSFVADSTQPGGVRADLRVRTGEQLWQPVGSLLDAGPAEAVYAVRMNEDGHVRLEFGDGVHGRRLPTAASNVRVAYRVGTGLQGKLDEGRLVKLAKPHYLVESVRQPLRSIGGNDMESADRLRENAPASVLTLDRAVSVEDFARLAVTNSSVWQARAFSMPGGGRGERIEVVVVPAGGELLGTLSESLRTFLLARAVPGVEISPVDFTPVPFDLRVNVQIDSTQFDPVEVVERLRPALKEGLSLERRGLGEDLLVSEIYALVEGTTGVANSTVIVDSDPGIRVLPAADRELIFLDPDSSVLEIESREFLL